MRTSNFSMQVEERTFFKKFDMNLALLIFSLNVIGLINLYSATHGVHATTTSRLFSQQIFWISSAWVVYIVMTLIDYQIFRRLCYVLYGLNIGAMLAVMFVGKRFYGAQRWLDLGFFRYQPSETMKLAVILVLAHVLSKRNTQGDLGLRDLIKPALITAIPFILTVKQPDLGTALLIATIAFSMIFFVGIKKSILATVFASILVASPLVWNFGLKEYQKNRILTFLDPGRDPRGTGYNSIQSIIAVGSGKALGKGFLKGTQSQLEFLPERHTDFIYSVLSEEHGFVGSITTFGLFIILFFMGLKSASMAKDRFGVLIMVGVISYLFWHVFVNIGMVIGLLPIVGVPLPLISYGGSSLLATMFGLGLCSSVIYRRYLF